MSHTNRSVLLVLFVLLLGMLTTLLALWRTPSVLPLGPVRPVRIQAGVPRPSKTSPDPGSHRRSQTIPVAAVRPEDAVLETVSIEIVDTPLREVLKTLQTEHGVEVWIDQLSLGGQSKLLDTEISLTARDVTLSWLLDRLLLPLKLDWLTDRRLLRITTQAAAQQHLEPRAYDVLDLIQSGFDDETLVDIVEGCVEPNSWASLQSSLLALRDAGAGPDAIVAKGQDHKAPGKKPPENSQPTARTGGQGRTRVHEGILIVWQTQRVHAQVELLLDQIEALLDDAEESRRFEDSIVTVKQRFSRHPPEHHRRRLRDPLRQ